MAAPLVVVAGLPRSGTSWIGKALSFAPGYTYFREPDNGDFVAGAQPWFKWLYLPPGASDPAFAGHMRRALSGKVATPYTMAENPGPVLGRLPPQIAGPLGRLAPVLYMPEPATLVKLTACNLALDWVAGEFPHGRVVLVIRHPCGTFGSWRRLGWPANPHLMLRDERLVADHLAPYVDVIERAEDPWERAGVLWAAITLVNTRQLERYPDWLVVQHEWLCEDPVGRFGRLYATLGLDWNEDVARFLAESDEPGDGTMGSLRRVARDEIDRWKRELDPAEIAACRRGVEAFDLPWYPDFEPVTTTPRWARGEPPH